MGIKGERKQDKVTLAPIKIISIVDTGGIWTSQRFVTCTTSFQASCAINTCHDAAIRIT